MLKSCNHNNKTRKQIYKNNILLIQEKNKLYFITFQNFLYKISYNLNNYLICVMFYFISCVAQLQQ